MLAISSYLRVFILAFLLGIGAIIGTNLVVDPIGVYRFVDLKNFNAIKPKITEYRVVWKLEHSSKHPAKVFFFGDSRTEMSVNPQQTDIPLPLEFNNQIFNFAVASSSIYAIKRYMQHLVHYQQPQIVAIGITASQFSMNQTAGLEPYEKYFATDSEGSINNDALLQRHITSSLSSNILSASLQTLTKQKPEFDKLSRFGFLYNERSLANIFKQGTQELRFQQMEKSHQQIKTRVSPSRFEKGMVHFREILDISKRNNIELVLNHAPTHVRLKLLQLPDSYHLFVNSWRRNVLEAIELSNKKYPDAPAARFMEFDLINEKTTEKVSTDNTNPMQWFIDPIHGSENFGNLMLEAALAPKLNSASYLQLTSKDLPALEKSELIKLKNYQQKNPQLLRHLKK